MSLHLASFIVSISFLTSQCAKAHDAKHAKPSSEEMMNKQTPSPQPKSEAGMFSTSLPNAAPFVAKSAEIIVKDGDEITLTASIVKQRVGNKVIKRLAYNGSIPGPVIKAPAGASIKLKLVNNTDVETTLHSHGLRLDYRFDGVPGVGQQPIKPGESFVYTLKFPDAGLYWYHPHIREDYAQEMGLYGTYYVSPKDPNFYNSVDREQNIVIDDINLNPSGTMPEFSKTVTNYALMGRFGNVLLANDDPNYQVSVKGGEVVRFFITNAANTRTFRLRAPGIKMKRVGSDMGLYEKETMSDEFILAPAERAIFEAYFDKEGTFEFQHAGSSKAEKVFAVTVVGAGNAKGKSIEDFEKLREIVSVKAEMKPVRDLEKMPPKHSIALSVDVPKALADHMKGMNHGKPAPIEWEDPMEMMNAESISTEIKWNVIDKNTGKVNMDIKWIFKKGEFAKIRIFNDPNSAHPMQHPMHFHGQRFAVLSEDGITNDNLVWKDTVLVKTGSTVDVVIEASNPGEWMGHCHIAEHLSSGMMFGFNVLE